MQICRIMEDLERFINGQRFGHETALSEMVAGEKRSHWIWYIFPQLKGLGHSPNSQFYGINGLEEAKAYLQHPVLGPRLREITSEVLKHSDRSIREIMGSGIDAMKFRSSMTLFDVASPDDIFKKALDIFFDGEADNRTLNLLGR